MSANLPHEIPPVINFRDPAQGQVWISVDDRVMGGVSASQVTVTAEGLVFSGEVSLAHNGGFASILTAPAHRPGFPDAGDTERHGSGARR